MSLPALPTKVPSEIPLGCEVLCVGEAPGKNEQTWLRPFVGGSGQLLRWALKQVGFDLSKVGYTNVIPHRPPDNKLPLFCIPRAELREHPCPDWYRALPATIPGKIIHPSLGVPSLEELYECINNVNPKIIIALGNTACWALLHQTGIERLRGAPMWDFPIAHPDAAPSRKVLPTYHPAAITRNYKLLPIMMLDLLKALNEKDSAGIVWPERWLEIFPTPATIRIWLHAMAHGGPLPVASYATHKSNLVQVIQSSRFVAVDVETERKPGPHITLIGFAPRPELSLVIPFINPLEADRSYYTREEEKEIILLIKAFMENPSIRKCFHNSLYDLPWIHSYGINPQNAYWDTMLMSHALWPEMRKSLRLLASILTNERNWKFLRTKSNKRED